MKLFQPNIAPFGVTKSGEAVSAITLDNGQISCQILTYGATIRSLSVPDRDGNAVDVVLGYDTLREYETQDGYLGATIGRFANRIAYGHFTLKQKPYILAVNNGEHHLHGGIVGFSHRVWSVETLSSTEVCLSLFSADGEEGYPGNMQIRVIYSLHQNALSIQYHAVSDADTICNLTNHSYFNLSGHGAGSVLDQEIQLHARNYTPSDGQAIPTGVVATVLGTPMDLTHSTRIGTHIEENFPQLTQARGYDHNYVVNGQAGMLRPAAKAYSEDTGIAMELDTTFPGIQFYTANFLEAGRPGKNGSIYGPRHGFCLETQFFPDSPNHTNFPSVCLKAGELFNHTSVFSFANQPDPNSSPSPVREILR